MQATEGDNTKDQPAMWKFEARKIWDAWNSLKGMSQQDAKVKFIIFMKSL
jgi:diazepam-binding inhibitor (GABA receptor modulating acyl-CoA-binding protein)